MTWAETKTLWCALGKKQGSDIEERESRREKEGWETVFVICVFIMGCLLSRRREGGDGIETAAPLLLLPWKPREMLDIKKWLIHTRLCLQLLCVWCVCEDEVCCFIFMRTDIFRCEKLSRGNILTEGHIFLDVSLTCFDSSHIQRSQRCWAVTLILSKNSQLKTEAPETQYNQPQVHETCLCV